jgi:sec-independent protein translocase protein TatC
MDDFVKNTRSALNRAELPGMSLIEHLEELRKRIIHSAIYLAVLYRPYPSGKTHLRG